jgi:glycosyltransferase involved in cell wall biosynthesis
MKRLSICIPTYNRVRQLSELQAKFLTQALDRYQEHIDVIVMDQSNDSVSTTIQHALDSRIIYYRNSEKGYAANINALLNQANSTYIWLISDDDHILWSGFEAAMREILKNESDCIMLPISSLGMFDDPITENYSFLDRAKQLTVKDLLLNDTGHLPFVLLSEAMVRLNKDEITHTYIKIPTNIFVQVPILFSMLSLDSSVCVVNEPVINYVNDVAMQWQIIQLIDDRFAVIDMLSEQYPAFKAYSNARARAALVLGLCHSAERDAGLLYLPHSKKTRPQLAKRAIARFKIHSLPFLTLLALPKVLFVLLYKTLITITYVKTHSADKSFEGKLLAFKDTYKRLNQKIARRQAQILTLRSTQS